MIELEEKHQPPELNSEGVFCHGKDPAVVFSRHPGLFMLMNSFFSLGMSQTVDLVSI